MNMYGQARPEPKREADGKGCHDGGKALTGERLCVNFLIRSKWE
jgi:hypothetical protein